MTLEVKAALREKIHSILERIFNVGFDRLSFDFEKYEEKLIAALQPEIERLVVEARVDENLACQRIIKSKWGTNDQLWDMEHRIAQLTQSNPKEVK